MQKRQILNRLGISILSVLLVLSVTAYLVVNNTTDDFSEIKSPYLKDTVKVYRDEMGAPTIIGSNIQDVLYAQGYEYARDRLWQLEFYRSVANGELSRLFGSSQLENDMALRKLGIHRAAVAAAERLPQQYKSYIENYIAGVNDYIRSHRNALPFELELLGVQPKEWTVVDTLSIQGVMAFDLAYGGLSAELRRLELVQAVGGEKSLEVLPVVYAPAGEYIKTVNVSEIGALGSDFSNHPLNTMFGGLDKLALGVGSNNWVISGNLTESGFPILANDMHLGLSTPGIWYQVHLIATDGSINVQGFSLPGAPFIIVGHNEHITWGFTNTGLDAIDLFYLKRNETHYLVDNTQWVPFNKVTETIPVKNQAPVEFTYELSQFGVMDTIDGTEYAVRWTLTEGYERDQIFRAIYELNVAENVDQIHSALEYFAVPGQNVVFATVDGDIGYQFTGLIPTRTNGFGVLPQNGSNGLNDWNGTIPYEDQLFVVNPSKGFFGTANQEIDDRHLFYIAENYAVQYRGARINQILANRTNFEMDGSKFDEFDIMRMHGDVYSLAVDDILIPVMEGLKSYDFTKIENSDPNLIQEALGLLDTWDHRMVSSSPEASIFVTFRINFVHSTFVDELGYNLTKSINYAAHRSLVNFLKHPQGVSWFDDVRTSQNESYIDTAAIAFSNAINFLKNKVGNSINDKWEWGNLHQATFKHVMGEVFPFLNVGPAPANGTTFTINAGGGRGGDVENLSFEQSHGPSERLIVRVEPKWEVVYGLTPPGIKGDPFSKHYDDAFDNWRLIRYSKWTFSTDDVISGQTLVTTYHKEE
ncbi:MAG: penicillin acylase family protein [Methanobacteriota archaeon]|nr:MAG: penicillin acylase family protein [Euryarchaeota archaeon]